MSCTCFRLERYVQLKQPKIKTPLSERSNTRKRHLKEETELKRKAKPKNLPEVQVFNDIPVNEFAERLQKSTGSNLMKVLTHYHEKAVSLLCFLQLKLSNVLNQLVVI